MGSLVTALGRAWAALKLQLSHVLFSKTAAMRMKTKTATPTMERTIL